MALLNTIDKHPQIMGILNVTPDSFSDGGKYRNSDAAIKQAEQMILHGAEIIDIGGESTRPGAQAVSVQEELDRTIPVIEAIAAQFEVSISIDTSKPEVITEAVNAGADLINDVRALQYPGALEAAAQTDADICLMHMQGQPRTMQDSPSYQDVLKEVKQFFEQRITACEKQGISKNRLILDPGFGFGKTLDHNYHLLANLSYFEALELPLLVGVSRKSMIGNLLNRQVEERLAGSIAGALIALQQGAKIVRVHDVKETSDALKVLQKTIELI